MIKNLGFLLIMFFFQYTLYFFVNSHVYKVFYMLVIDVFKARSFLSIGVANMHDQI